MPSNIPSSANANKKFPLWLWIILVLICVAGVAFFSLFRSPTRGSAKKELTPGQGVEVFSDIQKDNIIARESKSLVAIPKGAREAADTMRNDDDYAKVKQVKDNLIAKGATPEDAQEAINAMINDGDFSKLNKLNILLENKNTKSGISQQKAVQEKAEKERVSVAKIASTEAEKKNSDANGSLGKNPNDTVSQGGCSEEKTVLHYNYLGACGYTQSTSFTLAEETNITRIRIWYDTSVGGNTLYATLSGPNGYKSASGKITKGGCQGRWCEASWNLNQVLKAGTYTLTADSKSVCSNPSGQTTLVLYGCAIQTLTPTPNLATGSSGSGTEFTKTVNPSTNDQTITTTDGAVTIVIPGGLLTKTETLTIKKVNSAAVPAPNTKALETGDVYDIKLGNLTSLSKPITLKFAYDPSKIRADIAATISTTLSYYDETQKAWIWVPATIDQANKKITATIQHLSCWAWHFLKGDYEVSSIGDFVVFWSEKEANDRTNGVSQNYYETADVRYHIDPKINDYVEDVIAYLQIAFKAYKDKGFRTPPETDLPISVYISEGSGDFSRGKFLHSLYFSYAHMFQYNLKYFVAHEVFHSFEGSYLWPQSMGTSIDLDSLGPIVPISPILRILPILQRSLWFVEGAAEYAAEHIAWKGTLRLMGKDVQKNFLNQPLYDVNAHNNTYDTSIFIKYLVDHGANFKDMCEYVFNYDWSQLNDYYYPLNEYLSLNVNSGLPNMYLRFSRYFLFDSKSPMPTITDSLHSEIANYRSTVQSREALSNTFVVDGNCTAKLWGIWVADVNYDKDTKRLPFEVRIDGAFPSSDRVAVDVFVLKGDKRVSGGLSPTGTFLGPVSEKSIPPIISGTIEKGDAIYITAVNSDVTQHQIKIAVNFGPHIESITPSSGKDNDVVTIAGTGLGGTQGSSILIFSNGKTASPTTWSETKIVTKVPEDTSTGNVFVTVNNVKSNEVIFSCNDMTIDPKNESINIGTTQAFIATVRGSDNGKVKWSIQEGASGGTISSVGINSGVYTAPTVAGTYHVVATSLANPSKSAVAAIHVISTPSEGSVSGVVHDRQYHLSYTITGPDLKGQTSEEHHSYSGKVPSAGGALTISGRAWADPPTKVYQAYPARVKALVQVDGETVQEFEYLASKEGEILNKSFSLSVKIPPNANSVWATMSVYQWLGTYGTWDADVDVGLNR